MAKLLSVTLSHTTRFVLKNCFNCTIYPILLFYKTKSHWEIMRRIKLKLFLLVFHTKIYCLAMKIDLTLSVKFKCLQKIRKLTDCKDTRMEGMPNVHLIEINLKQKLSRSQVWEMCVWISKDRWWRQQYFYALRKKELVWVKKKKH